MSEKEKPVAAAAVAKRPGVSAEKRAELRAKALLQVEDEARKAAEKKAFDEELDAARVEAGMKTIPEAEEMVTVTVDLPEMSPFLLIDHKRYWHGQTYTVSKAAARSMSESMNRQWSYMNTERDGKSLHDWYKKPRHQVVGPQGMQ